MSANLPIIAIGGTLCDQRIWAPVLDEMGVDGAVVVAGKVDGETTVCTDMSSYATAILETLPDKFILVGFSLGGLISLEIIAQSPKRVAGLALISAGVGAETEQGAANRRADEALAAEKGMIAHASDDLWPRVNAQSDTDLATYAAMAEAVGLDLYRKQNNLAISRQDSTRRVGQITVPVLLVSGAQDSHCPPSQHAAILGQIPNASQAVIENAGHMVAFDQPKKLVEILYQWIADVKGVASPETNALKEREHRQEKV